MATRLIGTDSANPRLPDDVIAATVGTEATDLAAGDTLALANAYTDEVATGVITPGGGGSFVGAFNTATRPDPTTIDPGYYYWDLDTASPYWCDGATWRGSAAVVAPDPPALPAGVTFTIADVGVDFEPWITLRSGSTGTVNWYDSDDEVIAAGTNPTIIRPDDGEVTMRVLSGAATVMSEVDIINLGFLNTQDNGRDSLDATYNYAAQPVTGVDGLAGLTGMRLFLAANTQLTGHVDFTGCEDLEHIECYDANITSITLTGCSSLERLCVENNALTVVDMTPVASTLRDLRCADNATGAISFLSDHPLTAMWHYCTQGQPVIAHIPMIDLPVVEQYWVWDTGITTMDPPVSPLAHSLLMNGNVSTSATVDAWLIALSSMGHFYGGFDAINAAAPTAASDVPRAALLERGWRVDVPASGGGGTGWTYAAPTQGPWVGGDLTGVGVTPSVSSGVLTSQSNGYARTFHRPSARSAGNVFYEIVTDRTEVNGAVGTDWWVIFVNCDASGNGGLRCTIRWPMSNSTDATGVNFGLSNSPSNNAGTTFRANPNPAGWTDAGNHKIGILHQGTAATLLLDGVKVWQCTNATIGTYAGGGYVGVGGDSVNTPRIYQSWGIVAV